MPTLREMMAAKTGGAKEKAPPAKEQGLKVRDPSAPTGELIALDAPKQAQQERQLDQVAGDAIPMDHPGENASPEEKLWWQARHATDHELVIWIEPMGEHAWVAVEPQNDLIAPLVLLQRLPLASNPAPGDPY